MASGETEAEAKKAIRDQIDACSLKSDIDPVFLRRDGTYNNNKTLTLDEQKTLANNLGVLHSESAQGKLVDTGWKQIRTGNGNDLYARQFGPVVCIQGMLKVEANGFEYNYSAFGIEAPKYKVEFVTVNLGTNNTDGVSLTIDSGECIIKVNNQHKFSGLVEIGRAHV